MEQFVIPGRILTPESNVYALTIAILFCLGIYSLSTLVQDRWLARWRHFDFWSVHVGTGTIVVLWCSFVLDTGALFDVSLNRTLLSLPSGVALGWGAVWLDRSIVRSIARSDLRKRPRGQKQPRSWLNPGRGLTLQRVGTIGLGAASPSARQTPGRRKAFFLIFTPPLYSGTLYTLLVLILMGVLEEIIFRGFLVEVCSLIPQSVLRAVALAGTVAVFAIGHVQFGWTQVFAKLPLGAFALISVLLLKTVLPAILIHTFLNWIAWRDADGDLRLIFRSTW